MSMTSLPKQPTYLTRRQFFSHSALGLVMTLTLLFNARGISAAEESSVMEIGSRRELLVDDCLIERFDGKAELRLHHPQPREVVIVFDQPWEGNTSGYHSIIKDGDLYRLFFRGWQYRIEPGVFNQRHGPVLCYAESRDGLNWTRPDLGLVGYPGPNGSKQNNILSISGLVGELNLILSTFTLFRDENPACEADARYKGLVLAMPRDKASTLPKRGLMPFKSPDGLRWTPMIEKQVIIGDAFDSPNLAFWDSERGEYRAYWRYVTVGESGGSVPGSRRDIKTAVSNDFINWTEGMKLEYPGAPVEQLYTNQIKPYHRAPHIFIGLPARYLDRGMSESISALPDRKHRELRATGLPRAATALTDTLLMTSRDGLTFHRWAEAFLPPGPQRSGSWAYGDHYVGWHLVETRSSIEGEPNELSLYSTEDYWTGKGSKLRRYTLRMDGFVSATAPMSGGEVVTKPFTFTGNELTLNFSTSAAGSVQVEIQDEDGKPMPGFAIDDCPPVFGDSVERSVSWKNGKDLSSLADKPVRLRFVLKDADVFAFQFTSRSAS